MLNCGDRTRSGVFSVVWSCPAPSAAVCFEQQHQQTRAPRKKQRKKLPRVVDQGPRFRGVVSVPSLQRCALNSRLAFNPFALLEVSVLNELTLGSPWDCHTFWEGALFIQAYAYA